MGMRNAAADWTAARVRTLPDDGRRYEVVDGELLVTPAPRWAHQRAVLALARRLGDYLTFHQVAEVTSLGITQNVLPSPRASSGSVCRYW